MEKKDTRYCGICGNLTAIDGHLAGCPNAIYGEARPDPDFLDDNFVTITSQTDPKKVQVMMNHERAKMVDRLVGGPITSQPVIDEEKSLLCCADCGERKYHKNDCIRYQAEYPDVLPEEKVNLAPGEFVQVSDIEQPSLMLQVSPDPLTMTFCSHGKQVGEFRYDREAGRWTFEGNADKSALEFAKYLNAHFQSIINGDRDGILTSQVDDPDKWDPPLEPAEEPLKINTIPLHKLPPYGSAV